MRNPSTLSFITCALLVSVACTEGDQSLGDVGQNTGEQDGGTGGAPSAGGATSPGGRPSAGGATSPGGFPSAGGATSPGGFPSAGGATSPGGGGNLPECVIDCEPGRSDLQWGPDGGLVAIVSRSLIRECSTRYEHFEAPADLLLPETTCFSYLPLCYPELGDVSFADVFEAMAHADVQAALAEPGQVFGSDARPVDGQVLAIKYGDVVVYVGGDCNGVASCTEVPDGLRAFADVLLVLDAQELARGDCNAAFGD